MRDPSTEISLDADKPSGAVTLNSRQKFDRQLSRNSVRRRGQWYEDHKEEMKSLTVRQRAFLKAYTEECLISKAAYAVNIDKTAHAQWYRRDSRYKRLFDDLDEHVVNTIEDALYDRSINGVEEPVFYQGEVCGYVTKRSDQLLMFLLRAKRPDKYRERATIDVNSTTINPEAISPAFKSLGLEDLRRVREIVEAARSRQITIMGTAAEVEGTGAGS